MVYGFCYGMSIPMWAMAIMYLYVLSLVTSTLGSIFQTMLYMYARDGQVPQGFNAEALKSMSPS